MTTRTAKLVCFGRGGDSVHYGGGCTGSGYGSPESPHAAKLGDPETFPDGTPVIDKRPAIETKDGFNWVFRGPMCDPDIADGDVSPCPVPSAVFAGAMAESGNEYGSLLALQASHGFEQKQPGPLDTVSVAEYVRGWREHGARIGEYKNGQIVWTD